MIHDENRVYEGDEWKTAKYQESAGPLKKWTRAQEQARLDTLYAENKITHDEWVRRTDLVGDPTVWTAQGLIQ